MNLLSEKIDDSVANLPRLVTIICHLMTCYAMHPCEEIAKNINRHMQVLLSSAAAIELGEWRETFLQLQIQWDAISQRYEHQKKMESSVSLH